MAISGRSNALIAKFTALIRYCCCCSEATTRFRCCCCCCCCWCWELSDGGTDRGEVARASGLKDEPLRRPKRRRAGRYIDGDVVAATTSFPKFYPIFSVTWFNQRLSFSIRVDIQFYFNDYPFFSSFYGFLRWFFKTLQHFFLPQDFKFFFFFLKPFLVGFSRFLFGLFSRLFIIKILEIGLDSSTLSRFCGLMRPLVSFSDVSFPEFLINFRILGDGFDAIGYFSTFFRDSRWKLLKFVRHISGILGHSWDFLGILQYCTEVLSILFRILRFLDISRAAFATMEILRRNGINLSHSVTVPAIDKFGSLDSMRFY